MSRPAPLTMNTSWATPGHALRHCRDQRRRLLARDGRGDPRRLSDPAHPHESAAGCLDAAPHRGVPRQGLCADAPGAHRAGMANLAAAALVCAAAPVLAPGPREAETA